MGDVWGDIKKTGPLVALAAGATAALGIVSSAMEDEDEEEAEGNE